ncbi:MAG TPA: aromatic ring-hydroxylating dioxygenase subunit alpha [Caulobacteraceae bacterium]|jgi:phenylpropionate dioxygenase-like ring-hydroxylating dioxygenase large terminal subunit
MSGGCANGLTPTDYHAAASFERERRERLAPGWTPVCRAEELAGAGAQKAVVVAGQPVLVARGTDGAVRALSNVCRHRGMILVEGDARGEVIRCPYHLWAYGLDGRLAAAPFMGEADLAGCDLPRYAAGEWGGWVFVSLAAEPAPLDEALAPLSGALDAARLAELKIGYRLAFEHDWNWKVMVENFGESYHHIGTHAQTLQTLWPGGRTDASPSGAGWIDLRHPDHPQAGTLQVYVVFPLFLLALTPADGSAVWYRLTPVAPERIALEIVGLFPPEAAADRTQMAAAKAQVLAIHMEDVAACERVQAGLRAPDAVLGPLSPLEAGVARFRAWVAAGT